MNLKNKILQLVKKMGEYVVVDEKRTKVLFYVISFVLAATSFVMSVVNIFTKEYALMIATLVFSVLCLTNALLLLHTKINVHIIYFSFAIECLALLLFFIISGIPNGFSALWLCMIPSFAMVVYGKRRGTAYSMLAFVILVFLFWTPFGRSWFQYDYTEEFLLRFPFLYLSMFAMAFLIEVVRSETQRHFEETQKEYLYLCKHDSLTGLLNRYGMEDFLQEELNRSDNKSFSVIMFDIDDFKSINDTFGHGFGDVVLAKVAKATENIVCEHCRVCRWGGEEFVVVMRCNHDVKQIAESLRGTIANMPIRHDGKEKFVTVSVGICPSDKCSEDLYAAVSHADRALYDSKKKGKNCVSVAGDDFER